MNKLLLFISFILSTLFINNPRIMATENNFIRVKGLQFELNGKPYYFVGTNLWFGCYLGASGEIGNRERLIRELDHLKELGISNLRVLAASESSYFEKTLQPPIQSEPGKYNEQILEGLDFLLSEMRKREMYAVVFLNNYWEWSGGFAAYNKWTSADEAIDPYKHPQGWEAFMNYSASFYSNEKGNELYRTFIYNIITRKNKFTGEYYWQDPTIMSWQLANEPRPGQGIRANENIKAYNEWIVETAKYIKSIDPNHLVSTGSEGVIGSLQDESNFINAHNSVYIDYLTFHLWSKNWGWYDATKPEETFPITVKNALDYFNLHMKCGRELGKPVTMEEFGLGRELESCDTNATTIYRDKYFDLLYNTVIDSVKSGAPIAGTNFWAWGGEGRGKNKDYYWLPGDPFVGDPPHEPQGLNTVFNVDTTTLQIIKRHSEIMNSFRQSRLFHDKQSQQK